MTDEDKQPEALRRAVIESLGEVAPDVDTDALDPAEAIRDQFEFDSMDRLNFATALHERFGIDIPERDYRELESVDSAVRYLESHVEG